MKLFKYKQSVNFVLYSMMLTFIPAVITAVGFTLWQRLEPAEDDLMLSLSAFMFVALPILLIGGSAMILGLPEILVYMVSKLMQKPVTYLELDSRMEDIARLIRWGFCALGIGFLANLIFPIMLGMYWGALGVFLIGISFPMIGHFTYNRIFQVVDSFDIRKRKKKSSALKRATV